MLISEIFYSIQGEGENIGLPTVFVRFQFCPFRCVWCDSRYTWEKDGGMELSLGEVIEKVKEFPSRRICITGGEPLSQPSPFQELVRKLHSLGYRIEVETSGLVPLIWEVGDFLSWTMDIKPPSSKMDHLNQLQEIPRLRPKDQLKFVINDRRDFDFAIDILRGFPVRAQVIFSPVWQSKKIWGQLAEWVKNEFPMARYSLQLHKIIWGDRRGV